MLWAAAGPGATLRRPRSSPSEHLRLDEDLDDLVDSRAVVLDDLPGLAGLRLRQAFDRLGRLSLLDGEVAHADLLYLFRPRGHDPFQRGVARLGDARSDADQHRGCCFDDLIAICGLAVGPAVVA